ncbi:MAG TPA: class I SAM-dependent methyltransferase [Polyangiales bacterium]|nr:class I SAM-dependent methyltransferase [Polyangiales bacterium]
MFSKADAYERYMGRWSELLAPALITFADVRDGETVLDVGTGTGALARTLGARFPSVRVTGVDSAGDYITYANQKYGNDRVQYQVGDARQLEHSNGCFDKALAALALNFVPNSSLAVREMTRVTKKGGVIAAAVWDYSGGMQMLRVFWDEARALEPGVGARDEANMPLCREGALATLWKQEGLLNVQASPLMAALQFASFDDYWSPFLLGQGPAGAHVASLSREQQAQLEQRLRTRLLGEGPDRVIEMPSRAWAVRGNVP